ncbi:hypothetical protein [Nocardia abscessus]|nr:hypothetical protein [Nocardia abscessus]
MLDRLLRVSAAQWAERREEPVARDRSADHGRRPKASMKKSTPGLPGDDL